MCVEGNAVHVNVCVSGLCGVHEEKHDCELVSAPEPLGTIDTADFYQEMAANFSFQPIWCARIISLELHKVRKGSFPMYRTDRFTCVENRCGRKTSSSVVWAIPMLSRVGP
jgi:hypothetical protein